MALEDIYCQIEYLRSEEALELSDVFRKHPEDIPYNVRDFHRAVLRETNYSGIWKDIFENTKLNLISYYRKDSYLLSDAPFIFKPVTAVLFPTLPVEYYGVDRHGLELLGLNDFTFFTALHPAAYDSCPGTVELIETLQNAGKAPTYSDSFEEFLANFWFHNIMDTQEIGNSLKEKFLEFLRNPKLDFNYFIETYEEYVRRQFGNYDRIIKSIDENNEIILNAGLSYKNLRRNVRDRLCKVNLFSEFIQTISNNRCEYSSLLDALSQLEKILTDTPECNKQREIGEFIFKYWQEWGTHWSYSEGNLVDYSARDLSIHRPESYTEITKPLQRRLDFDYSSLYEFVRLVKLTNIDDARSIIMHSEERKTLLECFIKDFTTTYDSPIDTMCQFIAVIEKAKKNDTVIEKHLEMIDEIVTQRSKDYSQSAQCISLALEGISRIVEISPLIGKVSGTVIKLWSQSENIRTYGSAQSGLLRYIPNRNKKFQPHYCIEFSRDTPENTTYRKPLFKSHLISLPYMRNDPEFSNSGIGDLGG